jgi:type III secretory pathway component EscV
MLSGGLPVGMNVERTLVSIAVAVLALLAVGVGVTAALDPYVWPSLVVGIPAGVVAALVAGGLTYRRRAPRDGPRTA